QPFCTLLFLFFLSIFPQFFSFMALEGSKVCLECSVIASDPDVKVEWILPDMSILEGRTDKIQVSDIGELIILNATLSDSGLYHCMVRSKTGMDLIKVSVKVGPNLGDSARLSCQATGEPTPRIMWISPRNNAIPVLSDRFQIMDNGTLVIKKITLTDEGKYVCVAQNSAGDDVKNMKLEVESQEPFINGIKGKSTTKVVAVSYQTALLDCRVRGKPEPRVRWVNPYGQSFPIPYLGGRFQVHRNGSLELRGVRKTDEGQYTCLAKNHLGEASLVVDVDVASLAEKPSFAVPNIEILPIKQDNGELILECPARGKPNPDFAWLLPNGTMLLPGVKLQRFNHHLGNGTLRISQPAAGDKGVYRCLAKNVAGQAEKRYALETGRKPVIRGSSGME
uniref:Ig-like domain-containing protein n=1 Tax=Sphaeramia orbicularis TaxID=375764 RepID=A0A673CF40_9TELE